MVGQGSTFRVFFQLLLEEIPLLAGKTAQPLVREESGTVLLIENEEMIRDMAKTRLSRLGCTVLAAKDGVVSPKTAIIFGSFKNSYC